MTGGGRAAAGRAGRAVFLDRDGTLIHDRGYLADPEGVELLPSAAAAVRRLNRAQVPVLLVTNQSGIGRGVLTAGQYAAVQQRLVERLAEHDARIDAVYHCPHAPGHGPPCECRKPEPGLFLRAAREHRLDLGRCAYIGDRGRDLLPGARFGGLTVLVTAGAREADPPDPPPAGSHVVASLEDAVLLVLARWGRD